MNIVSSLVIIAVAGLIHSSFQLSVSMLTLLGSHTIGRKRSQTRLVLLTNAFTFGAAIMTILLLTLSAAVLAALIRDPSSLMTAWTVSCGLLTGVGAAVWLFYYRKESGTTLWVPRELARYLSDRTKATKQSGEAFGLGLSSVLGELLFIFAPLIVSSLVLIQLPSLWQVVGIALYSFMSLVSLLIVNGLIGGGHSISRIQKWRETNKRFLQFAAGGGLIVLSFYLYVDQVVSTTVMAAAGSL